jgi:hypothetical protein
MKSNQIYFETLSEALDAFIQNTEDKGAVFASEQPQIHVAEKFNGGVSYGATVSRSFELATLKGKATRKFAHCVVYRMESGRYELTSYVL